MTECTLVPDGCTLDDGLTGAVVTRGTGTLYGATGNDVLRLTRSRLLRFRGREFPLRRKLLHHVCMSVSIRPWQADDVPRLFDAVRESINDLAPFLPWAHAGYGVEESRLWVERQPADFASGVAFSFVITDDDGLFLGGCGLNDIDALNRRANLGYWVRSSATRRGVATTATRLVAAWAFRNTELIRLEIVASVRNAASIRVAEKAGAKREGVLRSRVFIHGESHDAVVFSIVRGDRLARD